MDPTVVCPKCWLKFNEPSAQAEGAVCFNCFELVHDHSWQLLEKHPNFFFIPMRKAIFAALSGEPQNNLSAGTTFWGTTFQQGNHTLSKTIAPDNYSTHKLRMEVLLVFFGLTRTQFPLPTLFLQLNETRFDCNSWSGSQPLFPSS